MTTQLALTEQMRSIKMADLFAGMGGSASGAVRACDEAGLVLDLVAVNHWPRAIETHAANHPLARHFCQNILRVPPRKAIAGGRLDVLIASPECIGHSPSRGKAPIRDASRSSAYEIITWIEELHVRRLLLENVRQFEHWGPLNKRTGRPIKSHRGEYFRWFVKRLRQLGGVVEFRHLNAADYGDPTNRVRLFLQARFDGSPITWPEPTHAKDGANGLQPWNVVRHCIDWSLKGRSVFTLNLSEKTMARIRYGLEKFGGTRAEPFLVMLSHGDNKPGSGRGNGGRVRSIHAPMGTVTASGNDYALCEPAPGFILPHQTFKNFSVDSLDAPARTVTAKSSDHALIEPVVRTMPPPFLVAHFGERPGQAPRVHSIDEPSPTVTSRGAAELVQCEFVTKYYGTGIAKSVDEPLDTIPTKDRFGLVTVDGQSLDILYRMLEPHELAAAMSHGAMKIAGNKSEQKRQIGNAWAGEVAAALNREAIRGLDQPCACRECRHWGPR
jgi:DNA (cytosine-5)-methyltransferase 1